MTRTKYANYRVNAKEARGPWQRTARAILKAHEQELDGIDLACLVTIARNQAQPSQRLLNRLNELAAKYRIEA